MRRRTTSWLVNQIKSMGLGRNTHIHAAVIIALIMLVAIVNNHRISQHRDHVLSQGRGSAATAGQHADQVLQQDNQHVQLSGAETVSSRLHMRVSQAGAGKEDPLARKKVASDGGGNAEARAAQLASAASARRKQQGGGGKSQAEESAPLTPPAAPPPPRAVLRREARLGPECGDAPADVLPALRVEAIWKPGRFMRDVKYDSALVTQLPFEMLDYLHLQCRAWTGRVAAAVYVPLARGANDTTVVSWDPRFAGRPLLAVRQALSRFYDALDPTTMCELEVQLVSEAVAPAAVAALPPVNALRNLALRMVDTEMVVMVDAHELPAQQLSMDLSKPKRRAALREQLDAGYVLVLPMLAISDAGGNGDAAKLELAKDLVSDGKAAAVKALRAGQAVAPAGEDGQLSIAVRATDYASWVQDSPAYEVTYEEGFQPVVLALRKDVPAFEERTRSATGGRVAHTLDMARHLSFGVHPAGFALALPRPQPVAAAEAGSLPQAAEVFKIVLSDMVAHRYTPFSRDSCTMVYKDILAPPSGIVRA